MSKINTYTCSNNHKMITVDKIEGTAPIAVDCTQCDNRANSGYYTCKQDLEPEFEWVRPNSKKELKEIVNQIAERCEYKFNTKKEINALLKTHKQHFDNGGLVLRNIETEEYIG